MTNFTTETMEKMANESKESKEYYSLDNLPNEYKEVYELVNMLSVERARNYDSWVNVCLTLYAISPKLFNLFVHFSKKSPNCSYYGCKNIWTNINNDGVKFTISSLRNWAKIDNPEKYTEMYYNKLIDMIMFIENPNHNDIADIIYAMYNDIYKCVSIKNNYWYEYKYHRWVFVDSGNSLQERIASEVSKEMFKAIGFSTSKEINSQIVILNKIQKICDCILKLKDQNYGATLIKTCARKFFDPKFEETLDANPYLIGFENGVWDLREKRFRYGMSDDRLTLSTGYDYIIFSQNDERLKPVDEFIKKILPRENIREYVLRLFSRFLNGNNKHKKFNIFCGSGANGKTKLLQLLVASLGQYAEVNFAHKIDGRDSYEDLLVYMQGKRFLHLSEPEDTFTIDDKKLDKLLGSNKVLTSVLSRETFEYTPQFNTILVCNKIPQSNLNHNSFNKINITKFESYFVNDLTKVNETKNIYLADTTMNATKIKEWAPAFMWILLSTYYNPKYADSFDEPEENSDFNIDEPEEVKKWTQSYLREQNQNQNEYDNNLDSEFEIIKNSSKKTTLSESERIAKLEVEVENLKKWIKVLTSNLSKAMTMTEVEKNMEVVD
jgi:hypothetical protein